MKSNGLFVLRSGWNYIGGAFGLYLLFLVLDLELFATFAFIAGVALLYIYRNPQRRPATFEDTAILSPAEGRVVRVENLEDDEKFASMVEIEGSYLGAAALRSPLRAKVTHCSLVRGNRLSPRSVLFEELSESGVVTFVNEKGVEVKVEHKLKKSFAPITLDVKEGDALVGSEIYGTAVNGITRIYLPHKIKLEVRLGQDLKAASSLLGYCS